MSTILKLHKPRAHLQAEQEHFILHLLASDAFEKYQSGAQATWTFSEACAFWQVDTRTTWGEALESQLDLCLERLEQVVVAVGDGYAKLPGGRRFRARDGKQLRRVNRLLCEAFVKHVTLLLRRRVKGS